MIVSHRANEGRPMRVSRSLPSKCGCSVRCAGVLLCVCIGLAALLLTSTESAAHSLHVSAPQIKGASAIVGIEAAGNEDPTGLETRAAPAGLGGGCSLVGLDAPRQIALPRALATGDRVRPASMKPARDIPRTPPCPPPT